MKLLHSRENEEHKFNRRLFLMGSAQAVLGISLIGRLGYIGLLHDKKYHLLSEKNSTKIQFILPQRGVIIDRNNQIIAASQYNYHLYLTRERCEDFKITLRRIQSLLTLDDQWYRATLSKFKGHLKCIPLSVYGPLSWEQVCKLEVNHQFLLGCDIEKSWIRHYPYQELFSHTIGYVQSPSGREKLNPNILKISGYQVGKLGLEKKYDDQLQGTAGYKKIEVDAHNRLVQNLAEVPSKCGHNLKTSLNLTLQKFTHQTLAQYESAAAVVIEIATGHILSFYSHPGYDPNLFVQGISAADWASLRNNPYTPLHNKVIQGCYPPGSIFKALVGLAAFESKLINPNFSVQCRGYIEVGHHRFHCWHRQGHGHVSINQALKQSCDVYFYEIAKIIGMQRIIDCAQKFGIGSFTGIEIDEKKGLLPTRAWKKSTRNLSWSLGDTVQLAIGQGDLLVTPLQLGVLTASLVNPHRQFVKPTLIYNKLQAFEPNDLNTDYLNIIKQGLDDTVNMSDGLAYRSRILDAGLEMGGKTSTAQVKRITMEERKRGVMTNEQRPWQNRDHAMFAGYAPIHHPKYAVAVVIEHGGSGGKIAAPIGRDLLLKTQQLEAEKK